MLPVYSVRFVAVTGIDAISVADFPFPAGNYTFVVTHQDVFMAGEGTTAFSVYDSYGGTIWSVTEAFAGTGVWEHWDGKQVYVPGDHLYAKGNTDDPLGHMDWSVSGYALSGAPPFGPMV